MGEVWAARNERTDRDFAIKFLLPYLVGNSQAIERFVREARATGQLHHPNIVNVLDAGRAEDGRLYLVMELLAGESLEQRLARERTLPQLSVCVLFSQIARALDAAHRAGLVHRDLSSGNPHDVDRIHVTESTPGAEPMQWLWKVDPPGWHDLAGEPFRGPIPETYLVGPTVLPVLGQEGELLAAWSAARAITRRNRTRQKIRRQMWSKIETG